MRLSTTQLLVVALGVALAALIQVAVFCATRHPAPSFEQRMAVPAEEPKAAAPSPGGLRLDRELVAPGRRKDYRIAARQ